MWEGSIKLYCISSPASHNGVISWSQAWAPHIGVGGKIQELGRRLLQQPREKVSREALERDRGIFMVINPDTLWIYCKD